jgi:hypothetical protein
MINIYQLVLARNVFSIVFVIVVKGNGIQTVLGYQREERKIDRIMQHIFIIKIRNTIIQLIIILYKNTYAHQNKFMRITNYCYSTTAKELPVQAKADLTLRLARTCVGLTTSFLSAVPQLPCSFHPQTNSFPSLVTARLCSEPTLSWLTSFSPATFSGL